ncbi:MAG: hypothetical protein U0521_05275 [Anaerolineae bacterium]
MSRAISALNDASPTRVKQRDPFVRAAVEAARSCCADASAARACS